MSTSSNPITDPRAIRAGTVLKYIVLILGFAIFAPFIWLAVGGAIGFALFIGVITATWMLKEPAYTWAANTRLKLIKAEVVKNPVETLQEEHRRNATILEERKSGIETLGGAIRTLDKAIDDLERDFPDSPELPQLRQDHEELVKLLESRSDEWKAAYILHGEFAKEIKRAEQLYKVTLAAAQARKQSGLSSEEWMSALKTSTAINSIRDSLNTQLSSLSTEKMQADADRILRGRKAAPAGAVPPKVQ